MCPDHRPDTPNFVLIDNQKVPVPHLVYPTAWTATSDQVRLRSREHARTDDEMTTSKMLLEVLKQRASLYTQCADTTVIAEHNDQLSTG